MMNRFLLLALSATVLNLQVIAQKKPNIVLILADDMGFSDIGAYGGEVQTPNIDRLAKEGLRYKQFYNAARCCPTRASLMTGLYPHQAGMGWMAAATLGTNPAYQDDLNKESVTIAEVLKTAGYSTYMTGKWHLTNERKIDGGVVDSWPKQRGFDRYFGIVPGGANYFTPVLYSNNTTYKAPDNFYLTHAITDTSVKFIDEHLKQTTSPFFLYVAYTAPHWPLHALQKDIDKYKAMYKMGWDKLREQRLAKQKAIGLFASGVELSPRDSSVLAWESLTAEQQEEMAMRMAIYAAQIDAMDQGIGKIVDKLKAENQLENTLIFFLSDNGACAEFISSGKSKAVDGTAETFESYRISWANASSTPYQQYKHYTHEGGIATPLIIHWPAGINKKLDNSFVKEYGHLTDIMATCVDVAGAAYPKQYAGYTITPLQGKSLRPHFTGGSNNRGMVYWEHEANIAMRDGKWKLVAKTPEDETFQQSHLQLYDMDADPSEQHDLAAKDPARVKAMYAKWMTWAKSIHAFPLDTREYNVRMQAYRRTVNGDFDDNLGGWNVRKGPEVEGDIDMDSSGQLTGKKSAHIRMAKPNGKPAGLVMYWPFKAAKGETFQLAVTAKSPSNSKMIVRLEKVSGDGVKLLDETMGLSPKAKTQSFITTAVPDDETYRIGLYFGGLAAGDDVYVDDIKLIPLKSRSN